MISSVKRPPRGNRSSYLRRFEPRGNDACLCGSTKRFKHCCRHLYAPSSLSLDDLEPEEALESVRAHITWYRLCHLAHTAPLVGSGKQPIEELLRTDIEALAELLEFLLHCYVKCQRSGDFPAALTYMKHAIVDPRWQLKLDSLQCLHLAVYSSNPEAALAIANRHQWQDIDDIGFLTLWLDLNSSKLNSLQIVPIAERIVSRTESDSVRLQYSCLIGIQHCLLNDTSTGLPMLEAAIGEYERLENSRSSHHGRNLLASAYLHLGELKQSAEHLEKALHLLREEVARDIYTPAGMAKLWGEIGACYAALDRFEDCERAYNTSLSFEHSALNEVFRAKALTRLGFSRRAQGILEKLDTSSFSAANYFDLAVAECYLAIATRSTQDIERALKSIREIQSNDPYFQDAAKTLMVQLYELREANATAASAESTLARINRYVKLQPNLWGIGFDGNAMIKDYIERKARRAERAVSYHKNIDHSESAET
jgi:tetratricopeptide (TPR) repeat protein